MASPSAGSYIVAEPADIEIAFEEHSGRVYQFLLRRSGNHHDAEDLTQQVFVDALKAFRASDDEVTSVRGWLLRVAERRFIDELRRRSRHVPVSPELRASADEQDAGYGVHVSSALREGILALPEQQRVVVIGHLLEGRSHSSIAEGLGISEAASKMRLVRGMKTLRDHLRRMGMEP